MYRSRQCGSNGLQRGVYCYPVNHCEMWYNLCIRGDLKRGEEEEKRAGEFGMKVIGMGYVVNSNWDF